MGSDIFIVETIGKVARCTMNSPKNMNALGPDLVTSMLEAFDEIFANDSIRVVVLRGEGGNFSSGGDVDILGENMDPVALNQGMKLVNQMLFQLHQGSKPVITEVDGFAVGGGMGLALASDITYATERALFSLYFIRLAAVPDLGAAYFLTERVGMALAKEIALTGKTFGAEKALDIGLINKVSPHGAISEKVMDLAEKVASRSSQALEWTKRALNMAPNVDLKTSLDFEAFVQPIMLLSQEHKGAIKKFLSRKD